MRRSGCEGGGGREGTAFHGAVKHWILLPLPTAMLTPRVPVRLRQDGEMPSHAIGLLRWARRCHAATEMLCLPARLREGEMKTGRHSARLIGVLTEGKRVFVVLNQGGD